MQPTGQLRSANRVGLKLQERATYSSAGMSTGDGGGDGERGSPGALKRYTSGAYSEEYSTAQSDACWRARSAQLARTIGANLPTHIKETITSYKLVAAY